MTGRILAFSGSARRGSLNQRLLDVAATGARLMGAEVSMLGLSDLELPIYNEDVEGASGLPFGALRFQALLAEHDGLLIATPEYNGGYTALLKNALDWASRPARHDRPGLSTFAGMHAAMVSASPGLLGGIRSQVALQGVLHKLGVHVIPASFALGSAHEAFDHQGELIDARASVAIRNVGSSLARMTALHARTAISPPQSAFRPA